MKNFEYNIKQLVTQEMINQSNFEYIESYIIRGMISDIIGEMPTNELKMLFNVESRVDTFQNVLKGCVEYHAHFGDLDDEETDYC